MTTYEQKYSAAENIYKGNSPVREGKIFAFVNGAGWAEDRIKAKIKKIAKTAWDARDDMGEPEQNDRWFEEWFTKTYPEYS